MKIQARRRNGKGVQRLQKLKVYRDGVTASIRYTFFMSKKKVLVTFGFMISASQYVRSQTDDRRGGRIMDTKALRQKILDLAIRGKLVPQDPNDEPASVLLERIREQKKQMVKEGKLKAKDIKNDSVIFVGEDNLHYTKIISNLYVK